LKGLKGGRRDSYFEIWHKKLRKRRENGGERNWAGGNLGGPFMKVGLLTDDRWQRKRRVLKEKD